MTTPEETAKALPFVEERFPTTQKVLQQAFAEVAAAYAAHVTAERDAEIERLRDTVKLAKDTLSDRYFRIAKLEAAAQSAHDLLCWTYQHCINVEPDQYSRNVKDLHPGVINNMNSAERDLYLKLAALEGEKADG